MILISNVIHDSIRYCFLHLLVRPSLYSPEYCEEQPALLFGPVDPGSAVEPAAAVDSSDQKGDNKSTIRIVFI